MTPIRIVVVEDISLFRDGLISLLNGEKDLEVVATTENPADAIDQIRKALLGELSESLGNQHKKSNELKGESGPSSTNWIDY